MGCTVFTSPVTSLYEKISPKVEPPIINILCLWQPGEGRDGEGLPTRGFVGQIFFFGAGSKTPVEVGGDVNIYVFDDFDTSNDQGKPIHIFEFEGGSWRNYTTTSNIGTAYQVFIPYTRKGNHQVECTLRIKYTTADGQPVYSDASNVILSGTDTKEKQATLQAKSNPSASLQSAIIPTSYEVAQDNSKKSQQAKPYTSKLSVLERLLKEKKHGNGSQNNDSVKTELIQTEFQSFSLSNKAQLTNGNENHKQTSHPLSLQNHDALESQHHKTSEIDNAFKESTTHPLEAGSDSRRSSDSLKVYSIPLTK